MYKMFLVLVSFLSVSSIFAQKNNTPYDFPIKPGTEEWKFSSTEEMYNKCQIPDAIISNLTTEALVKTCLSYPLFGLMNAYNTPQVGFNAVRKNFNGIDALLERKDAGSVLLAIYKSMNPQDVDKSWTLLRQGKFTELFRKVELLLSQNFVQNTISENNAKSLLRESKSKYDAKTVVLDVFGNIGLQSSLFPAAKILDKKGLLIDKKNSIISFLETGHNLSEADLIELYNQLKANQ